MWLISYSGLPAVTRFHFFFTPVTLEWPPVSLTVSPKTLLEAVCVTCQLLRTPCSYSVPIFFYSSHPESHNLSVKKKKKRGVGEDFNLPVFLGFTWWITIHTFKPVEMQDITITIILLYISKFSKGFYFLPAHVGFEPRMFWFQSPHFYASGQRGNGGSDYVEIL